jgi:hypothetical protein
MSLQKFITTWVKTIREQYYAIKELGLDDTFRVLSFVAYCLRDTFPWAYYVFIKSEIEALRRGNEIEKVKNETSQKVAFLLWWYYLSPAVLLPLKESLEKEGVKVVLLNKRQYNSESLREYAKMLKSKLSGEKWKDIVLFWYSSWGIIAHRISEQLDLKSVSFWTPLEVDKTMVGTLIAGTSGRDMKPINIPKNGVNLVETFSFMVPRISNIWENEKRLADVYSHMTIWEERVIETIKNTILSKFN